MGAAVGLVLDSKCRAPSAHSGLTEGGLSKARLKRVSSRPAWMHWSAVGCGVWSRAKSATSLLPLGVRALCGIQRGARLADGGDGERAVILVVVGDLSKCDRGGGAGGWAGTTIRAAVPRSKRARASGCRYVLGKGRGSDCGSPGTAGGRVARSWSSRRRGCSSSSPAAAR